MPFDQENSSTESMQYHQSKQDQSIMRKLHQRNQGIGLAISLGIVIGAAPLARTGWTGSMNGTGFGRASVNVTSSKPVASTVTSATMIGPSAAMVATTGYSAGGPLPEGSSPATVALIKGSSGYIWRNASSASNGDKTDNPRLDGFVVIPTSTQATTTLEFDPAVIQIPGNCGAGQAEYTFTWHWTGTDGTAQLIRFFEYTGGGTPNFVDDVGSAPDTDPNFVKKANDALATGCYGEGTSGAAGPLEECPECYCDCECNPEQEGCEGTPQEPCLTEDVPNTVTRTFCASDDPEKVFLFTDGVAVSLPCGIFFSGFQSPIGGADATGGTCASPIRTFEVGSTIPVKMTLLRDCDGVPITTGIQTIAVSPCTPSSSSSRSAGDQFRHKSKGNWHYNLNTKNLGMTAGNWTITATLSDGQVHTAVIALKAPKKKGGKGDHSD